MAIYICASYYYILDLFLDVVIELKAITVKKFYTVVLKRIV